MEKVECYICEAEFVKQRGDILEKRCPACRILKLGRRDTMPYVLGIYVFGACDKLDFESGVFDPCFSSVALNKLRHDVDDIEPTYEPLDLAIEQDEIKSKLDIMLRDTLNAREETVLRLIYGLTDDGIEYSCSEIAKMLERSSTLIYAIEQSAMKKLKNRRIAREFSNRGYFETFGYYNLYSGYTEATYRSKYDLWMEGKWY